MTIHLYEQTSDGQGWHHMWTGPVAAFVYDNELDSATAADIRAALNDVGQYYGGGGAAPEYKLVRVKGERS